MQILVNGESREIKGEVSILQLLQQLDLKTERVAVEQNLKIVPRSAWGETPVREGDQLEIVHFVGGGSPVNQAGATGRGNARSLDPGS